MRLPSVRQHVVSGFVAALCAIAVKAAPVAAPETRGTWLTTTGNDAISTPAKTAETMRRLRDIGLNTVYVECWKNGYTQFPSKVLHRTIGVDRRPALMPQDPSDRPDDVKRAGRDLLGETLIEAHRNGLNYVAWFEYGFMAAHQGTDNHLRRMKKEWLSLDQDGKEVAPNGFVWMNPLHPEASQFLLDLVLEAVDQYDLDGVQLDDRIVWPYYTMGYDAYTTKLYAQEHDGKQPPKDAKDAEWMQWRSSKVNAFSKRFVQELRARRPRLKISLSPAVYPWCYEYYLLDWPRWSSWIETDRLPLGGAAGTMTPRWDEFVPQVYRMNYGAYEKTWNEQVDWMKRSGGGRVGDMIAGIRVVGDGPDSSWEDLKKSIELERGTGGGGHVLWYSRGVLDLFPEELKGFYGGQVANPKFVDGHGAPYRTGSVRLARSECNEGTCEWRGEGVEAGKYSVISFRSGGWKPEEAVVVEFRGAASVRIAEGAERVELLRDMRLER